MNIIDEFLNVWEEKTVDWYLANCTKCKEYRYALEEKLSLMTREERRKFLQENYASCVSSLSERKFGARVHSLSCYKEMEKEIREFVAKDKERKRAIFISRIEKKVGKNILDANLVIQYGDINGIIVGDEGTATVTTISAGGYNIQCFHFRVLIKKLK